jgi:antirestriction protein
MRVYIASLSDYNNGRLEGKWFDLSDYLSASDLMDDINDMLKDLTKKYKKIDGEVREEWAVHDYEGIPPTLASEYMGEADFQKLMEIRKVAEDRDIPVEVLVERAGDTGSDDYEALTDSLVMVVDGSDETDIVYELESQMGELGNDFWKDYIFIDDVTERVIYGEDVDRFREDILYENPDMDEDEAESQAEEMADEEADRRKDLSTYLEDMGYGDEIPNFVTKDYNDAWKYALSYDYDVIHYDDQMYVFTNNYSVGGTILSGLVGAYIGYKIGRAKPQKKGFATEKKIGRKIKGALSKKKYSSGGGVSEKITKSRLKAKLYEPTGDFFIEDKGDKWFIHFTPKDASKNSINLSDLNAQKIGNGYYGSAYSVDKVLKHKYARGGNVNTGRSWHLDRARHNKRESYEKPLANRKRKYEDGGQIGQEIVFDDNGEENTGVIKDVTNLGDYVVKSDDGRTLLAQRNLDVISLGAMRSASTEAPRKRFGFFENGGIIAEIKSKYQTAGSDSNGVYTYSKSTADEIARKYDGDVQEDGSQWYVSLGSMYSNGGGISGLDDLIRG